MILSPSAKLWNVVNVIVSSVKSTPPPIVSALLSNSISLNLSPTTGSKIQPDPLPPVKVTEIAVSISKSCGSTYTAFTLPLIIGSTRAVTPVPVVDPAEITIFGGLTTS